MKKEEKTKLTKEKILAAAMKEFGEKGYMGGSVNTISNAGIPKGLLYHNYAGKDAVYLACVERSFSSFTNYLSQHDPGTDIKQYMKTRLYFFQNNEAAAKLFFEAILHPPLHLKEQINELRKEFDMYNHTLYKQILETVTLREGITQTDAIEYFILMQNMFNGYFSSTVNYDMPFIEILEAHEKKLPMLMDFMLYGIALRKDEE